MPAASPAFRFQDLAVELQFAILDEVISLSPPDLCAAAVVCQTWNQYVTPHLYRHITLTKSNREAVFAGLGLDYLSASALESRADDVPTVDTTPNRKVQALSHVKTLAISDSSGALALAEALVTHDGVLSNVEDISIGSALFRHLVNSGLAAFGRPRSGSAFVGETLVARLKPKRVHIDYPASRVLGSSAFDPVLLARVLAVLMIDWNPETVDYHGVGSDFPPVLGAMSRIHCAPCMPADGEWDDCDGLACGSHGALVRMHLRRLFGQHARDELLEAIAEGADPTDDEDLDPDDVPDALHAKVEYHGVPCIVGADMEAFLHKTFAHWPVEIDLGDRVAFYP